MGAPAARCYEFSRRWVEAGNKVSVICGIPNHPVGKVYEGYKKKLLTSEVIDNIHVYRSWVYVTPNAGTMRRSLNYLSFAVSSLCTSELIRNVDIVIASSPQFLVGVTGIIVKYSKRIPFILEVRDLWPDSIRAVEAAVPKITYNLLSAVEKKLYSSADHIIIASNGFRNHLLASGVNDERITTITNGVNTKLFKMIDGNKIFLDESLRKKFIVTYIGTLGMAHGLETILKAAKALRDHSKIHFLFVGEGARKKDLKRLSSHLDNITFIDRQPRSTVAQIINESDVALVLLKDNPLFRTVIPSKMFEIMGCGCPIILGVEGEAKKILDDANCGLSIRPENHIDLCEAIMKFFNNPALMRECGQNAIAYVTKHYNLDMLATRYLKLLNEVVSNR